MIRAVYVLADLTPFVPVTVSDSFAGTSIAPVAAVPPIADSVWLVSRFSLPPARIRTVESDGSSVAVDEYPKLSHAFWMS